MKKLQNYFISCLLLLIASANQALAQDCDFKPIAKCDVVVSYSLKYLWDYPSTTRNDTLWLKGKMLLEIGEGKAHCYDTKEQKNILRSIKRFKEKNTWRFDYEIHALFGETFIGYPKAENLTQVVNLDAAGIYQYSEKIPDMKWKIENEHKKILDYDCQRATCSFRGRDYVAWFASEIPLQFGPYKFYGLPGLILEIYDTKQEYTFVADGLEKAPADKEILIYDEEAIKTITREKARKSEAMAHKAHGDFAEEYGVTLKLMNGDQNLINNPMPYYPIELK